MIRDWRPHIKEMTTRLRVVVAMLFIFTFMAVSTNYGLYYRLTYILTLVLVLSYLWTWANGRWIEVSVDRDVGSTRVGGWLEERIFVTNRSRFAPVGWVDLHESSDMPDHGGEMVISLPNSATAKWTLKTRCKQRGRFSLGPVSVISGDPLGLFRKSRSFGKAQSFLVYPAVMDLPNLRLLSSDLPGDNASRLHTHAVTPDAAGVREYAPGDSFNSVHWKTTARMGKLMVKEFEQEESTKIWIVLDMQGDIHAGVEEESTEEYGVTTAASIADKYLQAGLSVGLIAHGDVVINLGPKPGINQRDLIMEGLAEIRARGTMALGQVLGAHEHVFNRYCTVVVITPSTDESWPGSLQRLALKRVQTSAVLLEAHTFGGDGNLLPLVGSLAAAQVPTCLVSKGDELGAALDFGYARKTV